MKFYIGMLVFALASQSSAALPFADRGTEAVRLASQNSNSIVGFVFGTSGRPVPDIYVELLNEIGSTLRRAKTSGSGMYTFNGLSDGVFTVRVLPYASGYQAAEQRVSLVSISAVPGRGSTNEQVDFYLKPALVNRGPLAAPEVVFAQEIPDEAKKLYKDGIELLADKKENEGFEKLKSALELFPTYYLALDRLGTEYVVRGHYRPAYVLLDQALAVNPRSSSSRLGMGITQFNLGLPDEAIKSLTTATEEYGESAQAWYWLGVAQLSRSKLALAETALIKANRLAKGNSADVQWQLAKVYKEQERYAEAADALERVLKIEPAHANAENIKKTIQILREKAAGSQKKNARATNS